MQRLAATFGAERACKPAPMPADPRAVESLLAFWVEAGVDVTYADAPVDRMAAGLEALKPRPAAAPQPIGAPRAAPAEPRGVDPGAVARRPRSGRRGAAISPRWKPPSPPSRAAT